MSPDDPTPTAPLRPLVTEQPGLRITRGGRVHQDGQLGHLVVFDASRGSLTVVLYPDRQVDWTFTGQGGTFDGSDIIWRLGRLVRSGPGARAFFEFTEELGLSFGQVEAELRQMSGYVDGTE